MNFSKMGHEVGLVVNMVGFGPNDPSLSPGDALSEKMNKRLGLTTLYSVFQSKEFKDYSNRESVS